MTESKKYLLFRILGSKIVSVYKVPQKELAFIFDEIVNYADICSMPGFEDASRDMVDVVLPEAAKFFRRYSGTDQSRDG